MSERTKKKGVDTDAITQALSTPFDLDEVKFKPQVVKGNRAMALAYIDARVIQDRLDGVLGVDGWQDEYTRLEDGSVICKLRLRIGDEWITKMDVGSPSEQPDGGDRTKAAFSDALKRAAVKFGIGRYLYRLPQIWCDYDPLKKQFPRTPSLPAFALPAKPQGDARPVAAPKLAEAPEEAPASEPAAKPAARKGRSALPADGAELVQRLRDYDAKLTTQGLCDRGALVQFVTQEGVKAGHGADLSSWSGPAIELAVEKTKTFEANQRRRQVHDKAVA